MTLDVRRDDGFSLVELAISSLILGFVLAIAATAMLMMARTEASTAADTESLTTLRFARDAIERDIRSADQVLSSSTKTLLGLWIDENDDDVIDTNETVQWAFETGAVGVDLVRTVEDSGERLIAGQGLVDPTGRYEPFTDAGSAPGTGTSLIEIVLLAEAQPGEGEIESIAALVSLRNKQ